MDIEYLLFLQNFRISINDSLTPFLEYLSLFAVTLIRLLPAFVYWCVDKKKGLFTIMAWNMSVAFNVLVKNIACVYRPWIREPKIIPAGDAIATAGGYSFPSGHTATVTPIYGSFAMFVKNRVWKIFWVLAIFVTMFSRNYLGVHTPQDVIVGFAIGCAALFVTCKIFAYIENKPEREDLILGIIFVLGLVVLIYTTYKSYPIDYDASGKILVKPDNMRRGAWADIGGLLAFVIARFCEKRWVKFSSTGVNARGIILAIIGMIPLSLMILYLKPVTVEIFGAFWGRLAYTASMIVYIVLIYPIVLKFFARNK